MHHGVFCGHDADQREKRILILGESHHISTDTNVTTDKDAGVPASYTTASVVQEYFDDLNRERKSLRFFEKIAKSFGEYSSLEEERKAFWETIYFGNYIPVLCGIQNGFAREQLRKNQNYIAYNDQLFAFANAHEISKIFCFSVLAYKSLPALSGSEEFKWETIGMRGNRRVYLRQCQYKAGVQYEGTNVILRQDLDVYGISHPSARGGYSPEMYAGVLRKIITQ